MMPDLKVSGMCALPYGFLNNDRYTFDGFTSISAGYKAVYKCERERPIIGGPSVILATTYLYYEPYNAGTDDDINLAGWVFANANPDRTLSLNR